MLHIFQRTIQYKNIDNTTVMLLNIKAAYFNSITR